MEIKLGELIVNFDSKRRPLSKMVREKMKGPYPYYGAASIFDYINDYIFDGEYILLGEDGTVLNTNGTPILQLTKGKFWANNHTHVLKNNEKLIDFKYLYYLLKNTVFSGIVTGAVQQKISQGQMNALIVNYNPDKQVQKKIASILSSIDDKIELNNKMNSNLLETTLCNYSILIEGKDKNGSIGEYCTIKSGFAFKSNWWTDSGVKVVKIGSINQDNLNLDACSYVSEDKTSVAKEFILTAGDLVVAMTGATIGKFAMVPYIEETILTNQRVGKFFLGSKPLDSLPFIYCTLKQPDIYNEMVNRGQGSAQPNFSGSDVMSIPCVIPNKEEIEEFNSFNKSLFERIIRNQAENKKLAELRDTLLPKLMSGEIDVEDLDL